MNYITAIFLLGLLILLHELGHFIAAVISGVPIEVFSVGFGPRLWSKKIGDTEYKLCWIPVGGYVMPRVEDEDEFFRIPVNSRIFFTICGPLMNFIIPLVLFAFINLTQSGFSLWNIFILPFVQTWDAFSRMLAMLPVMFTKPGQMSGLVGIVTMGGRFVEGGLLKTLNFAIMLSLNLAMVNLLPIPVMDGGKVLLYLMEKIHPKFVRLHFPLAVAGWIFVLGIMIYATVLDLGRLMG